MFTVLAAVLVTLIGLMFEKVTLPLKLYVPVLVKVTLAVLLKLTSPLNV